MERFNFRRAGIAFAVVQAIALLYPIALLTFSQPATHALRWWAHSLTFSLHHHTAMALAAGLFAGGLDSRIMRASSIIEKRLLVGLGLPLWLLLIVGVILIEIGDASSAGLKPPYLEDQESRTAAYKFEAEARHEKKDNSPLRLDHRVGRQGLYLCEYRWLLGQLYLNRDSRSVPSFSEYCEGKSSGLLKAEVTARSRLPSKQQDGNWAAWAAIVIDFALLSFIATFVWYLLVDGFRSLGNEWRRRSFFLVLIWVCMGFWLPMRAYANWYEKHFFTDDYLAQYGAFGTAALGYVLLGAFLAIRHSELWLSRLTVAIAGVLLTTLGLVLKFWPTALTPLWRFVEPVPALGIGLVAVVLLCVLALSVGKWLLLEQEARNRLSV